MSDWFDKAEDEFLFDLGINTGTTRETAYRVYNYLRGVGLLDYDVLKEYFFDEYTEDE